MSAPSLTTLTFNGAVTSRCSFSGTSCSPIGVQFWNREEQTTSSCWAFCDLEPVYALCHASNSLPIGSAHSALGSQLQQSATSSYAGYIDLSPVGFKSGWLRLDLRDDSIGTPDVNHQLVAVNGATLLGLPALGFLALDYVNVNVTPGVLANYSGAYPHRAAVTCLKNADTQNPC